MSLATKLFLAGTFAATALAHGTVTGFVTDGKYNGGFLLNYYYAKQNNQPVPDTAGWYAENLDNGFVEPNSYGSPDIICHKNASPGNIAASVAAGGTIEFQWTDWPESHIGPVITYVANCGGDCTSADKAALKWVKIEEAGYDASTKSWAAIDLIANNNTWVTKIIALHGAGSANGAQNYPQCMNIEITGSGTDNPVGVLGTELYSADEPGWQHRWKQRWRQRLYSHYPAPSATSTAAPTPEETEAAEEPATPTPTTPAGGDNGSTLPETFTLNTFIAWLTSVAGNNNNARRHARDVTA
ncbi:unnamed protein product [Parascedosporium putredinis]|uniref:lytic cellulose monooxygenase (C4-dehydrogenating) n=1 Tax=Parascedosporium putredinis TaxID=1442378 RepID=A0A9P1M8V1_9PEZI|nr:unnamed protein product [Parascedosporium putredinis]CAI7993460.1 unnamed protein product [Parascedosporium putredinis]